MKIPETEVTQKDIALLMFIGGIVFACVIWIHQQTTHRDDSMLRWAEYDVLWEEPVEERRLKVRRALELLAAKEK